MAVKQKQISGCLFRSQVSVNDKGALGEAYVNVTVLDAPRVNIPPVAVISPVEQVLTLPTNNAILDGSGGLATLKSVIVQTCPVAMQVHSWNSCMLETDAREAHLVERYVSLLGRETLCVNRSGFVENVVLYVVAKEKFVYCHLRASTAYMLLVPVDARLRV